MRSAFGVPAFVIEFLLGKYCASTDEETISEGLEFVRETLVVEVREAGRARGGEVGHQAAHAPTRSSTRSRSGSSRRTTSTGPAFEPQPRLHQHRRERGPRARPPAHGRRLGRDRPALRRLVHLQRPEPAVLRREPPADPALQPQHRAASSRRGSASRRDQWLDLLMRSMGYEPSHPYYTQRRKLHYMLRLRPVRREELQLGRARARAAPARASSTSR